MSLALLASVALLPIALALVLMVGMRWPATRAMPLAWLVTGGTLYALEIAAAKLATRPIPESLRPYMGGKASIG